VTIVPFVNRPEIGRLNSGHNATLPNKAKVEAKKVEGKAPESAVKGK